MTLGNFCVVARRHWRGGRTEKIEKTEKQKKLKKLKKLKMFAPFSSDFLEGNGLKIFSFRENFQFPPTGGPRIRKLKNFGETEETEKSDSEKTENFCSIFVGLPYRKWAENFQSFALSVGCRDAMLHQLSPL